MAEMAGNPLKRTLTTNAISPKRLGISLKKILRLFIFTRFVCITGASFVKKIITSFMRNRIFRRDTF